MTQSTAQTQKPEGYVRCGNHEATELRTGLRFYHESAVDVFNCYQLGRRWLFSQAALDANAAWVDRTHEH